MRTFVYIDGFNLYHRALRKTGFKWLNVVRLAEEMFPGDFIARVCYFTALINARPNDQGSQQRQSTYLRALRTSPDIEIHFGTYKERIIERPLFEPVKGLPRYVKVRNSEEKGTDVNLATRLLVDGFAGLYEQAVVLSNDADFASPIKFVRDELGLKVMLINPDQRKQVPRRLLMSATGAKRLLRRHLRRSQFPPMLTDQHGTITKPPTW